MQVAFARGRLSVKTKASGDEDGSVAITIELPTGSGLVTYLAHSDVHAEGPLDEVTGTVKLASSGGQTWIGHAYADLALGSANGGFDVDRADGSVTASTANGAIRIGRLTRGQAELSNSSGNIEIGITEGTAIQVDARSTRGKVRNAIPTQESPDPTGTRVTVHARTRHGDIVIHRTTD